MNKKNFQEVLDEKLNKSLWVKPIFMGVAHVNVNHDRPGLMIKDFVGKAARKYSIVGYIAAAVDVNESIHIGISLCDPVDYHKFSRKVAITTAAKRALNVLDQENFLDPNISGDIYIEKTSKRIYSSIDSHFHIVSKHPVPADAKKFTMYVCYNADPLISFICEASKNYEDRQYALKLKEDKEKASK